jgi:hypothetical protein
MREQQIPTISVNEPVTEPESIWSVHLATRKDGFGQNVYLGEDEIAHYNADPDGFAARYFGLADVEEYREWVASDGAPRCSEYTRKGTLCSTRIGGNWGVKYWRQHHRMTACHQHGGDEVAPLPSDREPNRYSRKPARLDRRCEAIAKPPQSWSGATWQWGPHQCGKSGTHFREGHRVCHLHRDCTDVAFIDGGRS